MGALKTLNVLLVAALLASPAVAVTVPDGEGQAVQEYIRSSMDKYFHPAEGFVPRAYRPQAGVLHGRFKAGELLMEKFTAMGSDSGRYMLFCHGGAYVLGFRDGYRFFTERLMKAVNAKAAYAFDYRLAPDHVYPAALEDALTAYAAMLDDGIDPGKIIITGDSAGGNLALCLGLRIKELGMPMPAGLILISPWGSLENLPSRDYNLHKDYVLGENTPLNAAVETPAYAGGLDLRDPRLSPIYADLTGLPPMLIQAGGNETLRSDSELLGKACAEQGASATLTIYPGMPHDFVLVLPDLPHSQAAFAEMGEFADQLLPPGK